MFLLCRLDLAAGLSHKEDQGVTLPFMLVNLTNLFSLAGFGQVTHPSLTFHFSSVRGGDDRLHIVLL